MNIQRHCKPEWLTILQQLVIHDELLLFKICRKMIILLDHEKIPDIKKIVEALNPTIERTENEQNYGPNWPKPKGSPFNAVLIFDDIFGIAQQYLPEERITKLITQWLKQERMSHLSTVLENRHAPLSEVHLAVKKYLKLYNYRDPQPIEERYGLRVSLIFRFLSENLSYINIAKHYITISEISKILEKAVGPADGNGKLGGKSAGLILATEILRAKQKDNPLLDNVYTPKSWFLTSDGILDFFHYNALEDFVYSKYQSTEEIGQEYPFLEYIFKNSHFPPEAINSFKMILDDLEGKPIVIRSSSLLEDSFEASFSGKYKSLFISNTGSKEERMSSLLNAIAEVYASTFSPDPMEYRKERGLIDFREEMGILIQEVVGTRIGKYFLPSFAGVAFSNNEFRWSPRIKREDGVARLVAGLGTRAVDRTINDYPILVAPGQPGLKVNAANHEKIQYSQQFVDVINLENNKFETIKFYELYGESKGYFPGLEKIVSFNRGGTLVDPISQFTNFSHEHMIITFNPLIEKTNFIVQIREILKELTKAFNGPVDIEFASDGTKLYLLQCRPQSQYTKDAVIRIPPLIHEENKIFTAELYVSNGLVKNINYIVYVDPERYAELQTVEEMYDTGKIVSKLNRIFKKKEFILIGPGRWGSKGDIKLGVPVIYSDINNTAMLIEIAHDTSGYIPELSFGTHFFQDLVEANIKYLPLYPDNKENIFREDFFMKSPNHLCKLLEGYEKYESLVKVIKMSDITPNGSMTIYMDGDSCKAVACIEKSRTGN